MLWALGSPGGAKREVSRKAGGVALLEEGSCQAWACRAGS